MFISHGRNGCLARHPSHTKSQKAQRNPLHLPFHPPSPCHILNVHSSTRSHVRRHLRTDSRYDSRMWPLPIQFLLPSILLLLLHARLHSEIRLYWAGSSESDLGLWYRDQSELCDDLSEFFIVSVLCAGCLFCFQGV